MLKLKYLWLLLAVSLCLMMLPGLAAAGPSVVQGVYIEDVYYPTIQEAIDAGSGKVLRILPGSYVEFLSIQDKNDITLDVYDPGDEVTINAGTTGEPAISIRGASYGINIKNLKIKGSGEGCGIQVGSSAAGTTVTVHNNTITGFSEGIRVVKGSIELNGNTFEENGVPVRYMAAEQNPLLTDPGNNTLIGRVDIIPEGHTAVWGITQSIQEAVNYAPDGSTLNIYAGEYEEQVIVEEMKLNLIGIEGRDRTIIKTPDDPGMLSLSQIKEMYAAPLTQSRQQDEQKEQLQNERLQKEQLRTQDLPTNVSPEHPRHKSELPNYVNHAEMALEDQDIYMALIIKNYDSQQPVTVQGLTVTGLAIYGADGSVIQDNCFKDNQFAGVYLDSVDAVWNEDGTRIIKPVLIRNNIFTKNYNGLYLYVSNNLTVEENEFTDNECCGLCADDADGLILKWNHFNDNEYCGAYLLDVDSWAQDEAYAQAAGVYGNTFNNNGFEGLYLESCYYLQVMENEMKDNEYEGICARGLVECQISHNIITGNAWSGIFLNDSVECEIADNTISNNGSEPYPDNVHCGLDIWFSYYNKISGNKIEGNKDAGLWLKWSDYNLVKNNHIQNNGHQSEEDEQFGLSYGGILVDDSYGNSIYFNNFGGNIPNGLEVVYTDYSDAAPETGSEMAYSYQYNWWGDASGPEDEGQGYIFEDQPGNLLGKGDKVVGAWIGQYAPWLSAPFDTAYPGPGPVFPLPLARGWSLVSTPYTLGLNSWNDIIDLGEKLDASVIVRYDSKTKTWEECGEAGTSMEPQDAYFIMMNSNDLLPLVVSSNPTAPPVRKLEQGWNLASLASEEPMPVREALASVEYTADGRRGWVQVVKPPYKSDVFSGQDSWVYTVNSPGKKVMEPGAGYWIYMDNADELAGFTTTGPLQEPDWWQCYLFSQQVLTEETQH